jgi:hydrogenase expression/formation protein HypE
VVPKGAADKIFISTSGKGMTFDSSVVSDTAPLNHMVKNMLSACYDIHVLRDPNRGGVGTALNKGKLLAFFPFL